MATMTPLTVTLACPTCEETLTVEIAPMEVQSIAGCVHADALMQDQRFLDQCFEEAGREEMERHHEARAARYDTLHERDMDRLPMNESDR